jgi:hypothetical protein
MKVKVIKKAELESLGDEPKTARKEPKRRRLARAVEKWVADIRQRSEAEEHTAIENFFHTDEEPST